MVYVGGIAVMFLFLIMVVDVNIENVEGSVVKRFSIFPCIVISLLSISIVFLLMINLDVYLFNSLDFVEVCGDSIARNFSINVGDYFLFQHQLLAMNSIDL
jgi:NADH:ubiquinone oxidoreductase subunit 6 (subunit J)